MKLLGGLGDPVLYFFCDLAHCRYVNHNTPGYTMIKRKEMSTVHLAGREDHEK